MREGYGSCVVSVCVVCVSVPALAAPASVYIRNPKRFVLDFDSWIFENTNKLTMCLFAQFLRNRNYLKDNWSG